MKLGLARLALRFCSVLICQSKERGQRGFSKEELETCMINQVSAAGPPAVHVFSTVIQNASAIVCIKMFLEMGLKEKFILVQNFLKSMHAKSLPEVHGKCKM